MAEEEIAPVATRPGLGARLLHRLGALRQRFVEGFLGIATPPQPGRPLPECAGDVLAARRAALAASGHNDIGSPPLGAMGLALSGGGIRSATISLGVVQSLAGHKRLLDFDYLSTVSGGGYFGSFLTSLFVPDAVRGPRGEHHDTPDADELKLKREFALGALRADCRGVDLDDPADPKKEKQIRNPVWWLREHGRYLAPNGPTDYVMAATYMVRAWLAMIYVFLLPVVVIAVLTTVASTRLFKHFPALNQLVYVGATRSAPGVHLSLLWVPAGFLMFLGVAAGIAFWFTENWPLTATRRGRQSWWRHWLPPLETAATMAFTGAAMAVILWGMGISLQHLFDPTASVFVHAIAFGVALLSAAILTGLGTTLLCLAETGTGFTYEMRRRLTRWGSWINVLLLCALAAAVIDTLALNFYTRIVESTGHHPWRTVFGTLIVPAAAWLINQLPGLLGGKENAVARFLGRHLPLVALVIAALLYGTAAVLADTAVQFVAWNGGPQWPERSSLLWLAHLHWVAIIALIGMIATGLGTGFINLSSLHNLYAARLTRAYLGGSNFARLRKAAHPADTSRIQENEPTDDIDAAAYQQQRSAAPIHLINVTLNETRNREGSQLVERDRKGVPVVFAPEGVLIDAARAAARKTPGHDYFYSWEMLARHHVEALSIGQLCAISGAAASSGMGAKTTLGGALVMTFANIRLGYWWSVGHLIRHSANIRKDPLHWAYLTITRPLRTYFYLFNEMTARYSRDYGRLNISDGGHFDNSGVYELLRRKVPTILVCDNGADPDFAFEDLENLIRKARIDQGLSINVAPPEVIAERFGMAGKELFLNGTDEHWRDRAKNREHADPAFALLLQAFDRTDGKSELKHLILWLKPRLFPGLTQDVIGYSLTHPTFPHESTANQFFDEEQWESYRALGYCMMESLFLHGYYKDDCLRTLKP